MRVSCRISAVNPDGTPYKGKPTESTHRVLILEALELGTDGEYLTSIELRRTAPFHKDFPGVITLMFHGWTWQMDVRYGAAGLSIVNRDVDI